MKAQPFLMAALALALAVLAATVLPVPVVAAASVFDEFTAYKRGDILSATVDSFRSRRGLMPYDYYSLPIPRPSKERFDDEKVERNIGQILLGSREQPSLYNFTVGMNVSCAFVGEASFSKRDVNRAIYLAENRYYGTITLDGLPALSVVKTKSGKPGTRYGYRFGEERVINNFLAFTVKYANRDGERALITAFMVEPRSYKSVKTCTAFELSIDDPDATAELTLNALSPKESLTLKFYYSVEWEEDPNGGDALTRMDVYERKGPQWRRQLKGHWTAAANAVVLTMLLGVAVAVVVARTVRRDLLQYADAELADDLHEETGWKLVRGDVFRPPAYPVPFACVIAAGCQLLMMMVSVFLASAAGVLHPSQRGNLLTGLIIGFLLTSFVAGYAGARMLKFFKKRSWANGLLTVVVFPLCLATGYMSLNTIHWFKRSTLAIPFTTCLGLIVSWLALSIPLGIAGVTLGFRAAAVQVLAKVSTIPRLIPAEAGRHMAYHVVLGGLVPFSAAFIELVYVLGAFWQGERFHMLGFLVVISVILAALCGEVAIVVTYLALNHEDYRWWWRSFASLASAGVYLYLYSVFYLAVYLELRLVSSIILFLGYMAGVSTLFALMCGTVGFSSAAIFVRFIYNAVKGD